MGMMMFRPYLKGAHFTSWGDHKTLLPLYNKMTKAVPMRVTRHRNKVQDLRFTDKYLPGKTMPCDYASRHAMLIEDLDEEEKERLMVDTGEDIQVMRVFIADLPPTLSLEVLKEVAERDAVYQRLKEAVKTGRKPKDRTQGHGPLHGGVGGARGGGAALQGGEDSHPGRAAREE